MGGDPLGTAIQRTLTLLIVRAEGNTLMKSLVRIVAVAGCVWFVCALTGGENLGWKKFSSREGWSIQYPADWKTGSCHSCPDPHASGVFVDFFPPSNRDDGWVMVEPLQRKPTSTDADAWLVQVAANANQNPHLKEQKLLVAGEPALRVRYQAPATEMAEVFVVSGNKTFSIRFAVDGAIGPLERLPRYAVFNAMVDSFRLLKR